jgi:cytochrome c biogenesis protein ResB
MYVLVSLGFVVMRRGIPLRWKNFGFLMNHFGLWLTLLAAGMGSSDLKRVHIELTENGEFSNSAVAQDDSPFTLPFSIKLLDFNIEMYDAKIGVADAVQGKIVEKHGETLPVIHKGFETKLIDWNIRVDEYLPNAIKTDSGYVAMEKPGTVAAAYITTHNLVNGDTVAGWISSESMMFEPVYLDLGRSKFMILTEPEPRKFASQVVFKGSSGEETIQLEVNKPHRMEGWKLYQISYDTQMGKYSTTSVLEAVKDPWLPVVYAGVLLLLIGAVYMFWLGRGMRTENEK